MVFTFSGVNEDRGSGEARALSFTVYPELSSHLQQICTGVCYEPGAVLSVTDPTVSKTDLTPAFMGLCLPVQAEGQDGNA